MLQPKQFLERKDRIFFLQLFYEKFKKIQIKYFLFALSWQSNGIISYRI